jgi:oligopeptidase A
VDAARFLENWLIDKLKAVSPDMKRRLLLAISSCCLLMPIGFAQDAVADNPLVDLPYRVPFDRIKPEHIVPAIKQLVAEAKANRDAYVAQTAPPTWENTIEPTEKLTEKLGRAWGTVNWLYSLNNTPEIRKAYLQAQPVMTAFMGQLALDEKLAARLKAYAATEEAKALTGVRKRSLEQRLKNLRRSGVDLPEEQKVKIRSNFMESAKLSSTFANNALDSTNAFELIVTDEAKLAGLPPDAKAAAKESAKKKGLEGFRFTLQAPSVQPLMTYVDDASLREQVYRAQMKVGNSPEKDNKPIIKRLLELRAERAKILGYANWADFQTEERMAKSGDNVKKFLTDLETKSRDYFDKENVELAAFKKSLTGTDQMQPWDVAYYSEKLRRKLYDFDSEALRPYYPVDTVMQGMFDLATELYGVQFEEVKNVPVWNEEVRYYKIIDNDGKHLASFYVDLFPREVKRSGAWMSGLIKGGPVANNLGKDGGWDPHLSLIACNFTRPAAGKPALLLHREVETLFHEFGHLMHNSFGNVEVRSMTGASVAWDFVELPSQIMENFTYERAVIDRFAKHYETKQPLPQDLFEKMLRARTFRAANGQMRQLGMGLTDILLHTDYKGDDKDGDVVSFAKKTMQRFSPVKLTEDYSMITAFSHVFAGGYSAGYYSYKWSEVLDADAFTKFKQNGVISRKTGELFRKSVLEKGDSEDAGQLFRNFMGRDPNPDALLKRSGLK